MTVQDHPLLTSMMMLLSCTCCSRRGPTVPFLVQNTFPRRANRGLTCSNPHKSLRAALRSISLALLLLTLVSQMADKQHGLRICLLHLLLEN
ncbi:hypothetical protein AXF42_Ash015051 [Apostasia shenzhenica]|uniref:Uncharacterized protein n=1 Tax=Apostasia shenzhenica TaxID=1088818 RepID=A0A2I0B2Z6_9ASPA|nr:hypothetical protein AXF42_Ash015051 [Apostasia shenzhenica]